MSDPQHPALYQINTRVWLSELSRALGRRATLNDIPDANLDLSVANSNSRGSWRLKEAIAMMSLAI